MFLLVLEWVRYSKDEESEEMKMERRMRKVVRSREKMSGRNHFFFLCCCLLVSIGERERERFWG